MNRQGCRYRYSPLGENESGGQRAIWSNLVQHLTATRRLLLLAAFVSLITVCVRTAAGGLFGSLPRTLDDFVRSSASQTEWETFEASSSPYIKALGVYEAQSTNSERMVNTPCLESWIKEGELCMDLRCENPTNCPMEPRLDFVWSWTNGTSKHIEDRRLESWRFSENAVRQQIGALASRHFRSFDELRFSIRSVQAALPHTLGKIHILSTDLPSKDDNRMRYGLRPDWLDSTNGDGRVQMQYPWNTYKTSALANAEEAERWRATSLPTFQSHSVESTLPFLNNISDTWAYMCDDFFVMQRLTLTDLYSPLFGFTFRLQREMTVPSLKRGQFRIGSGRNYDGEWPGLTYTNWLLDQRFGSIARPYPVHHLKVFNGPLLQEVADIWADELTDTASQKFRGSGHDTNMAFFFINYVIERHREALLWSYLVARIDEDEDGWIDEVEKLDLFNFLAIHPGNQLHTSDNSIAVSTPLRDVDYGHYFQQAGLSVPLQTNYTFGSSNGYAYVDGRYTPWGHSDWPDFTKTQSIPFCSIDSHCLGLQPEEAVDLFKRVTFEHRKCGDCLIVALLHLSGKTGFGAFLPPSRQDDPPLTISNRTVTVLPKSKNWRDVDFSLHTITGHLEQSDESYQSFCIRLIHRYAYVIGDSALHFIRIGTTKQLEGQIEIIENNPKALLVLNDDIVAYSNIISNLLQDWLRKVWPRPMPWEKSVFL